MPTEFDIDQAGTVAAGRDLNVTLRHVGIQIKLLPDGRMATSSHDYERFIQKLLMPNAIAGRHGNVDGQVDRAAGSFGLEVSTFDARGRDRHAWGGMGQALQQGWKNQRLGIFPE